MSIVIEQESCNGCGRCLAVCPGALLCANAKGRAEIRYPADCWSCAACVKSCARGAIALYSAPACGGRGGLLRARREGEILHWVISLPDGTQRTISVDRRSANRY
ncbi:MAG: 4Fe-4S binding protein [Desulfovibrio sp.]|jgi:adenylylsulfate reductase subunit B|nr:4Fe-4S binding protein [Desulfovibrio sp.]